jgi:hypothetical protein
MLSLLLSLLIGAGQEPPKPCKPQAANPAYVFKVIDAREVVVNPTAPACYTVNNLVIVNRRELSVKPVAKKPVVCQPGAMIGGLQQPQKPCCQPCKPVTVDGFSVELGLPVMFRLCPTGSMVKNPVVCQPCAGEQKPCCQECKPQPKFQTVTVEGFSVELGMPVGYRMPMPPLLAGTVKNPQAVPGAMIGAKPQKPCCQECKPDIVEGLSVVPGMPIVRCPLPQPLPTVVQNPQFVFQRASVVTQPVQAIHLVGMQTPRTVAPAICPDAEQKALFTAVQQMRDLSDQGHSVALVQAVCVQVPQGFCKNAGLTDGNSWTLNPREATMFHALIRAEPGKNMVARPQMMITNNELGVVQVGQQVPVVDTLESSFRNGTTEYVARMKMVPTGIELKVTPRISQDGKVLLRVEGNLSELDGSAVMPVKDKLDTGIRPVAYTPVVNVVQFSTTVEMVGGYTAVFRTEKSTGKNSCETLWVLTVHPVIGKK